jgi:hypothetical protein
MADSIVENLLVALLAVNNWSLERVYDMRGRLRDVGLLDCATVSTLPEDEVAGRLAAAGYARGEYMNKLMAVRVLSMASVLSSDEVVRLSKALQDGRQDSMDAALDRIKGVGPSVRRAFWALEGLGTKP